MGRTLPSAAQLIDEQIAALKPMYGALRRSDQLILNEFYEACIEHRAAIANAERLLPLEGCCWPSRSSSTSASAACSRNWRPACKTWSARCVSR